MVEEKRSFRDRSYRGSREEHMVGMLATSRAGHDKDTTYVIIGEEKEYVYLADGRLKTVGQPKKKNKRHIQIIKKVQLQKNEDGWNDLEVKKILKEYHKNLDREDN